eukprot:10390483-Alexandrium_andersonii.AAC.1
MLRPFLAPRSSRFERLKRVYVFRGADCGLRRMAARTDREWIADCCEGPKLFRSQNIPIPEHAKLLEAASEFEA